MHVDLGSGVGENGQMKLIQGAFENNTWTWTCQKFLGRPFRVMLCSCISVGPSTCPGNGQPVPAGSAGPGPGCFPSSRFPVVCGLRGVAFWLGAEPAGTHPQREKGPRRAERRASAGCFQGASGVQASDCRSSSPPSASCLSPLCPDSSELLRSVTGTGERTSQRRGRATCVDSTLLCVLP